MAGITNANVVVDPHGNLTAGAVHRIPFQLAETEYGLDVFLLTPAPWTIDFELETPDGHVLGPASASSLTNLQYVQAGRMAYYRLSLPAIPAHASGSHSGLWHALLKFGKPQNPANIRQDFLAAAASGASLTYDLVVHCYSNLVFQASASQESFQPGAIVRIDATLREYTVPVEHGARCWAEVTRPDATAFVLAMNEEEPGGFSGQFATTRSGLYTMRVRAIGSTFTGTAFQREQTLTAAVYRGANDPKPQGPNQFWCELLRCVLASGVIDRKLIEKLRESGLNLEALLKCIETPCAQQKQKTALR